MPSRQCKICSGPSFDVFCFYFSVLHSDTFNTSFCLFFSNASLLSILIFGICFSIFSNACFQSLFSMLIYDIYFLCIPANGCISRDYE